MLPACQALGSHWALPGERLGSWEKLREGRISQILASVYKVTWQVLSRRDPGSCSQENSAALLPAGGLLGVPVGLRWGGRR